MFPIADGLKYLDRSHAAREVVVRAFENRASQVEKPSLIAHLARYQIPFIKLQPTLQAEVCKISPFRFW